jgi:exonuclease VII small subunit
MSTNRIFAFLALGLLLALASPAALGQNGPGQGPPGPGNMPPITPAMVQQFIDRMQQRTLDRVQTQLGMSDDDFAALKPYVQKVLTLQMVNQTAMATVMMRQFAGPGAGQGFNLGAMLNGGNPSNLQQAVTDLQTAIDNPDTPFAVYESKIAAYRAAKAKADDDLTAAQNALRDLLTQRQEATLVIMGLLQ